VPPVDDPVTGAEPTRWCPPSAVERRTGRRARQHGVRHECADRLVRDSNRMAPRPLRSTRSLTPPRSDLEGRHFRTPGDQAVQRGHPTCRVWVPDPRRRRRRSHDDVTDGPPLPPSEMSTIAYALPPASVAEPAHEEGFRVNLGTAHLRYKDFIRRRAGRATVDRRRAGRRVPCLAWSSSPEPSRSRPGRTRSCTGRTGATGLWSIPVPIPDNRCATCSCTPSSSTVVGGPGRRGLGHRRGLGGADRRLATAGAASRTSSGTGHPQSIRTTTAWPGGCARRRARGSDCTPTTPSCSSPGTATPTPSSTPCSTSWPMPECRTNKLSRPGLRLDGHEVDGHHGRADVFFEDQEAVELRGWNLRTI